MEKSQLIDELRTEDVYTDNGALTNSTTLSPVLDLFFIAGASRKMSEEDIEKLIVRAMADDKLLTLKVIFWAGRIRGGAGERRFFRIALDVLHRKYPAHFLLNFPLVPWFNRWDSLFAFYNDPFVVDHIANELTKDKPDGLLCKWLPRTDYSKKYGYISRQVRKRLNLSSKEYRKLLVKNTKVVENDMCLRKWDEIKYSHVPSKAMHNYQKAFLKHDEIQFKKYLSDVKEGKAKINSGVLFPHEILGKYISVWYDIEDEISETDVLQWNNLPNYLEGTTNSLLPMCDVSGSMQGLPIQISLSLGLYISERNEGIFKDAFLTFSRNPKLEYLKGTIKERIESMDRSEWDMNTDLINAFKTILDKAISKSIPESQMPKNILIISDMEFDEATDDTSTNFTEIKTLYNEAGYKLPNIIFWNVKGRTNNCPVTIKDKGVALVSGCSPSILKSIFKGEVTPMGILLNTVSDPVYDKLRIALASTMGV